LRRKNIASLLATVFARETREFSLLLHPSACSSPLFAVELRLWMRFSVRRKPRASPEDTPSASQVVLKSSLFLLNKVNSSFTFNLIVGSDRF
ncbi:hypothetical protein V2J09_006177, partial [Rumex salicifolius]